MAPDDEDSEDLYDDEFDFVDDDELDEEDGAADDGSELDSDLGSDVDDEADDVDDSEVAKPVSADSDLDETQAPSPTPRKAAAFQRDLYDDPPDESELEPVGEADAANVDDLGRPAPLTNFVVHIYEYQSFKRTIDRPFTAEDAEAFASEYNRTSKPYGRFAIAGKDDAKPRKTLT